MKPTPNLKNYIGLRKKETGRPLAKTLKTLVDLIEKNKGHFDIREIMLKRGWGDDYDRVLSDKDKTKIDISTEPMRTNGRVRRAGVKVPTADNYRQTEDDLKASEEKYRKLVTEANEAVIIIDRQGNINFANKAFFRMTGFRESDLPYMPFSNLAHPGEKERVNDTIKKLFANKGTASLCDFKAVDSTGTIKYLSCSSSPLMRDKKITGLQVVMRDITENIKLQEKLLWSKNHYEQVIDAMPDSICVIDTEYKIISANRSFADKVGLPVEKIKGHSFDELISRYDYRTVRGHCLTRNNYGSLLAQVFKDGAANEVIVCGAEKRSSNPRYYRIRVFSGQNTEKKIFQIVIIIRDITENVIAEKELQRLSEFNQKILDNAPVSIVVIDPDGKIKAVNRLFENFSSSVEPVGRNIKDIDFFKRENLVKPYGELLKSGRSFTKADCRTVNKTGDIKYISIIAVPLKSKDDKIEGIISMATDNTESVMARQKLESMNVELEKKVAERTIQLDRANKELRKVVDLKTRFISDASHELRTPLTIIKGNLDLAIKGADKNGEAFEVYSLIAAEIQQMTGILSDLTLLTSSDKANENIKYEKVNLRHIIKTTGNSLAVLAEDKNIKIMIKRMAKTEIMGDEDKLEKMMLNLLRNAIKYGRNKGCVKIWMEQKENDIKIYIKDNGIGISSDDLPYVFERFYRSDKARSMGEGGSGLGLAICKWIAEAHGGFITVESEQGAGSLFTVHLYKDFKKINHSYSLF